jgi:uncharacterized protein YndB with AHSA1/START domain
MGDELWPASGPAARREQVAREIVVRASREQVWEALATDEGRERWLELDGEADLEVEIEIAEAPSRLVWWWRASQGPATRVEFLVSAVADGTRVLVIERAPRFPIEMLASWVCLAAA